MKLRLTPRAIANLQAIADYRREQNPLAAARVGTAIQRSFDLLTTMPFAGRPQTTPGVRKLVVHRYPYLVYYAVHEADAEVVVLSIRHSSQHRDHVDA